MGSCASKSTSGIIHTSQDRDEYDVEQSASSELQQREEHDAVESSSEIPVEGTKQDRNGKTQFDDDDSPEAQSHSISRESVTSKEVSTDIPPEEAKITVDESDDCETFLTSGAKDSSPLTSMSSPIEDNDHRYKEEATTETVEVENLITSSDKNLRPVVTTTVVEDIETRVDHDSEIINWKEGGPWIFSQINDPEFSRICIRMRKELNHDPWNDSRKYADDNICIYIREHPETCRVKYDFDNFTGPMYPLSVLCSLGASVEAVKLAYEAYTEALNECDLWVGTPLHYACSYKAKIEVVEFLIQKQPDALCMTNHFGRTPLHMACLFKASAITISLLLQQYTEGTADVDKDGYTPLHLACENGASPDSVDLLVSSNPDSVEATTQYGSTPLHFACSNNASKAIVQRLLDANPNVVTNIDLLGQTPLHMAALGSASQAVVAMLVQANPAGVELLTDRGETPLRIAKRKKAPESVLKLLSRSVE